MNIASDDRPVPPSTAWHNLSPQEAALGLGSDLRDGLAAGDAEDRLARFGPNQLAEAKPRPKLLVWLDQFRNFLIAILLLAAVVSLIVSDDPTTPIVILAVVIVNATLGFVMENRAERSLQALRKMLEVRARTVRAGVLIDVPAAQLVPGDVVLLEAGDRVPADGRIVSATSLEIEEAALTGESAPVVKTTGALGVDDPPLGDRSNMAFMNTTVTRGKGTLLVTGTGMDTEIGKLAGLLRSSPLEKTPLQHQIDHLAHVLARVAGVLVVIVLGVGLLRGESFDDLFLTGVALAVASVPEGLPAVLAVTLALGAYQMAKRKAIVKRLSSVETLGATTVICSDKTGTLTLNQMTARELVFRGRSLPITGTGYTVNGTIDGADGMDLGELLTPMVLCNDAEIHAGELVGDPTEGALVVAAAKAGIDVGELRRSSPRVGEVPFDSAAKYMATFHDDVDDSGRRVVRMYVKGAPDVVLARSTALLTTTGSQPLDVAAEQWAVDENERLASQGLRVLAVARRDITPEEFETTEDLSSLAGELTWLGLAGILDPPRPEAKEAIALCHTAGITVKMITGDHATTARAIAAELGITGDVVTGADLDRMSDDELDERIDGIGVFARVAPEHKLKLVRVLMARGNVTAMTGDGVNDAPALRSADMGVAMGITGTEVTKEAATMVLADDNFATIVTAVKQGRTIYDNIVKFVRFQLSTTIGFGITFLIATFVGIASGRPFTALQILWVNIIMDGPPAMALGVDPAARDVMQRHPRSKAERILNPSRLARLIFTGAVMAAGTLTVLLLAPGYDSDNVAGTVAGTMAFTTFVFFQFFNLLNARNEFTTALGRHSFVNAKLWGIVAVVVALHVAAVHVGFLQDIFDTTDLTVAQWGICIAVASTVLWMEEARKLALRVIRRR